MRRTTVCLSDQLKASLVRAALISSRSQAALIREGVELVVGSVGVAQPRIPVFASAAPPAAEQADELLAGFGER